MGNNGNRLLDKEDKIKGIMTLGYFVSLFLFQLMYIIYNFNREMQEIIETDTVSPFVVFAPFINAGIYHFIIVSIIAIFVRFYTKIDKEYKKIVYLFPILTFFFTIPMIVPVGYFAGLLGVFN